jgi:hypothetical protein
MLRQSLKEDTARPAQNYSPWRDAADYEGLGDAPAAPERESSADVSLKTVFPERRAVQRASSGDDVRERDSRTQHLYLPTHADGTKAGIRFSIPRAGASSSGASSAGKQQKYY